MKIEIEILETNLSNSDKWLGHKYPSSFKGFSGEFFLNTDEYGVKEFFFVDGSQIGPKPIMVSCLGKSIGGKQIEDKKSIKKTPQPASGFSEEFVLKLLSVAAKEGKYKDFIIKPAEL